MGERSKSTATVMDMEGAQKQAPGDGEGPGSLARCSSCGHKESDATERLNNNYRRPEGNFSYQLSK